MSLDAQGDDVRALHAQIQQWRQEERLSMAANHAESKAELEGLKREMMALSSTVKVAFPGGDVDGHRRYHELLIEREEQRKNFWNGLLLHMAKAGTWAAVVGVFLYLLPMIGASIKEWIRK